MHPNSSLPPPLNLSFLITGLIKVSVPALASSIRFGWPALLALLTLVCLKMAWNAWRRRRLAEAGLADIDKMDGIEFEDFLAERFKRAGYRGAQTPPSGVFGAALVREKEGAKTVEQAHR